MPQSKSPAAAERVRLTPSTTLSPDLEEARPVPRRLLKLFGKITRDDTDSHYVEGADRLDNLIKGRQPKTPTSEQNGDVESLENCIERKVYQQERIRNRRVQRNLVPSQSSIGQFGSYTKSTGLHYPIKQLHSDPLMDANLRVNYRSAKPVDVIVPARNEYYCQCFLFVGRDRFLDSDFVLAQTRNGASVLITFTSHFGETPVAR